MDVVVVDAPSLIDDDGHQDQEYHDDGDSQGYCDDKRCFHIATNFAVKIQTASKTDVSNWEMFVPYLENLHSPCARTRKSKARCDTASFISPMKREFLLYSYSTVILYFTVFRRCHAIGIPKYADQRSAAGNA